MDAEVIQCDSCWKWSFWYRSQLPIFLERKQNAQRLKRECCSEDLKNKIFQSTDDHLTLVEIQTLYHVTKRYLDESDQPDENIKTLWNVSTKKSFQRLGFSYRTLWVLYLVIHDLSFYFNTFHISTICSLWITISFLGYIHNLKSLGLFFSKAYNIDDYYNIFGRRKKCYINPFLLKREPFIKPKSVIMAINTCTYNWLWMTESMHELLH